MATPPLKSQPLHNFALPHLRWAHKGTTSSASASHSHHRFRRRSDSPDQHLDNRNKQQSPQRNDAARAAVEEENGEGKPWNLRPRKEIAKATAFYKKETNEENNDAKTNAVSNGVKSQRLRGFAEGGRQISGVERKTKRKLWISLSREEIEEDVYALTGGKPARRPRKWPRNVQKQLDCVFPGLYLAGVAADSYRVMMF